MKLNRLAVALVLVAATAAPASAEKIIPWVGGPAKKLVTSPLTLGRPSYGLMADAGFPGGGRASLVYRPFWFLRAHAGGGYNMVAPGVHAGISVLPLPYWITPSLGVEGGRYFEGDAQPAVRLVTRDADFESSMLEKFGYDYASAWAGLEIGQRRVTFYIHGGYSIMRGTIHGAGEQIPEDVMVTLPEDPVVTVKAVSARIGLIVYLF